MKQFLLLFMLVSLTASAQYDRWAVGADFGVHAVGDQSALVTDAFNHYGLTARYSINPTVSVGLSGGFDNLTLEDLSGDVTETNYARINAEAFIDIFDILDLQNNTVTLLGHGGPGYSFIRNSGRFTPSIMPLDPEKFSGYKDDVFNITGGLTALVKINSSLAASLGYRTTANITQDRTLDGYMPIANADINSTVTNFTVGLTFYFGKKNSKYEHADWYVAPDPVYSNTYITTNNITREYVRNISESKCDCDAIEFVFFDHDKHKIKEEGLNAITKAYTYLDIDKNAQLYIRSFASATSSSDAYNKELASKRGNVVYEKLESMGADMNRVSVFTIGKDFSWADESIHDVARRVELVIIKKKQ